MPIHSRPTLWPAGFDPNDTSSIAQATIVRSNDPSEQPHGPHKHQTGQVTLSLEGLVGLTVNNVRWALPALCAIWLPPGVSHNGFQGEDGLSVYFHIHPDYVHMLPDEPVRLMPNTMTVEMIRHFVSLSTPRKQHTHTIKLAQVIIEELALARRLPLNFAPLPEHPLLKHLAAAIAEAPASRRSLNELAQEAGLSERSFSRLIRQETGMSYGDWRSHIVFLIAVQLLAGGQSVECVAFEMGYSNPSSFIARFKSVLGTTPGAYAQALVHSGNPWHKETA